VSVTENRILQSKIGVKNDSGIAVDASLNWWGTATPDFAAPFVQGNVVTKPYYSNQEMTETSSVAHIHVCLDGCAYNTIAAGVAAASAGDIVEVAAGTYAGGIAVNKAITVRGVGSGGGPSENTAIMGSDTGTGITTSAGTADAPVVIENVHISRFTTGVI